MFIEDNDSVSQMLALPLTSFVHNTYRKMLGRSPDALEVKSNVGALRCGLGRIQFLMNICKSQEFRTRNQQLLNQDSDNAFVAREFAMYLGRSPDPQGLEHYLKLLEKGKSRELIHLDISTSKEARQSYTFWNELDRILIDHRNNCHPLKRWIGARRRANRRANRDFELMISSSENVFVGKSTYNEQGAQHNADLKLSGFTSHQVSLSKVDRGSLNGDTRKILSRLQHASGISSSSRNHS
ncbi:DUF4214 domain-containing protein [Sphingobium sp. TomTYG45]